MGVAPNMAFQRSGGIGAILTSGRGKKAFPIDQRGTFPPPAERQAVRRLVSVVGNLVFRAVLVAVANARCANARRAGSALCRRGTKARRAGSALCRCGTNARRAVRPLCRRGTKARRAACSSCGMGSCAAGSSRSALVMQA